MTVKADQWAWFMLFFSRYLIRRTLMIKSVTFAVLFCLSLNAFAESQKSMRIVRSCKVKKLGRVGSELGLKIGNVLEIVTSTYANYEGPFEIHPSKGSYIKVGERILIKGRARYSYDQSLSYEPFEIFASESDFDGARKMILADGPSSAYTNNSHSRLYVGTMENKAADLLCTVLKKEFSQTTER